MHNMYHIIYRERDIDRLFCSVPDCQCCHRCPVIIVYKIFAFYLMRTRSTTNSMKIITEKRMNRRWRRKKKKLCKPFNWHLSDHPLTNNSVSIYISTEKKVITMKCLRHYLNIALSWIAFVKGHTNIIFLFFFF